MYSFNVHEFQVQISALLFFPWPLTSTASWIPSEDVWIQEDCFSLPTKQWALQLVLLHPGSQPDATWSMPRCPSNYRSILGLLSSFLLLLKTGKIAYAYLIVFLCKWKWKNCNALIQTQLLLLEPAISKLAEKRSSSTPLFFLPRTSLSFRTAWIASLGFMGASHGLKERGKKVALNTHDFLIFKSIKKQRNVWLLYGCCIGLCGNSFSFSKSLRRPKSDGILICDLDF